MLFNVDDITGDGFQIKTLRKSDWVTNIPELVDEKSDLGLDKNIDFDLNVTRVIRDISVNGKINFGIRAICSRCLTEVKKDLNSDVNLILTPKDEFFAESGDEDLDHEFYEGDTVDLSGYLRELIAITIPINFICGIGCKGLCSNCGINLNNNECNCKKNERKSAFAVLKDIKL